MFLHDVHVDLRILLPPRDSAASISRSRNYSNSNSSSSSSNLWSLRKKQTEPATEEWITSATMQRKIWYIGYWLVFFTASTITKVHNKQTKTKIHNKQTVLSFFLKTLVQSKSICLVKRKDKLRTSKFKNIWINCDIPVINKCMYWHTCIKTSCLNTFTWILKR